MGTSVYLTDLLDMKHNITISITFHHYIDIVLSKNISDYCLKITTNSLQKYKLQILTLLKFETEDNQMNQKLMIWTRQYPTMDVNKNTKIYKK